MMSVDLAPLHGSRFPPHQAQTSPSWSQDSGYESQISREDEDWPKSQISTRDKAAQHSSSAFEFGQRRLTEQDGNLTNGVRLQHGQEILQRQQNALPPCLLRNPRRTGLSQDASHVAAPQPPCSLKRGAVKRDCFVTRLVCE